MTQEKLIETTMALVKDVAAINESVKSAHHRLDTNEAILRGIHEISSNMAALTMQVSHMAERMTEGLQAMDRRIDALGKSTDERFQSQGVRIGAIVEKPAKKWEAMVEKLLLIVVGGVAAYFFAKFGF